MRGCSTQDYPRPLRPSTARVSIAISRTAAVSSSRPGVDSDLNGDVEDGNTDEIGEPDESILVQEEDLLDKGVI